MQERYNPAEIESRWQEQWAREKLLSRHRERGPAEVLSAGDVSLPLGTHPHGPRPQLLDRRRGRPLQAHAGLQRAPSHGVGRLRPAGGKCRHPDTAPIRPTGPTTTSPTCGHSSSRWGFSYDWDRELATCDAGLLPLGAADLPARCSSRGSAYKKTSLVNWCPSCETVLANEQVEDGCCWRCDSRGDAEGARAVVLPHHRLRRGAARLDSTSCPAGRSGC